MNEQVACLERACRCRRAWVVGVYPASPLTSLASLRSDPSPPPSPPVSLPFPLPLPKSQDNKHQAEALAAWAAAASGRDGGGKRYNRVVPVPADHLIAFSGSIHCMTRAVPRGTLPPGFVEAGLEAQRRRWANRTMPVVEQW